MKSLLYPSCFALLFIYGCAETETPNLDASLEKRLSNSSSFGLCNEPYPFEAGPAPCSKKMKVFHRTTEAVLFCLYRSSGNGKRALPKIKIYCQADGCPTGMGATYYAQQQMIVLDEKLIQVCLAFGKDSLAALAFVIGHELAHHFQPDFESKKEGPAHLTAPSGSIGDAEYEALADREGLRLAYSAGYKSVGSIFPKLMATIYKAYQRPDQIGGYPSLKERQGMAYE